MQSEIDVAAVAALMADATRARILWALSDGRALPAGELARLARVAPSTASGHLARLVEGRLLDAVSQGRHRYFRLADPAIVRALEALAVIAPPAPVRSLRESERGKALHRARTCYDHLAGQLGVALTRALVDGGYVAEQVDGYAVGTDGERRFAALGLDILTLRGQRRLFAPCCLDWSERRYHMAGALGAALAARLFALGWLQRTPTSRAVHVTEAGRVGLRREFGIDWE
jgi:DNA-binding transcriptional ArsR family regulator